jgi:preprotein translocase subunit SecD
VIKRVGKPVIFIIAILILALAYISIAGISYQTGDTRNTIIKGAEDIRFGIDIKGGVDVTFTPPKGTNVTKSQMEAAVQRLNQRLDSLKISDRELYPDYTGKRIIVRFPWQSGTTVKDPEEAIKELGAMSQLYFKDSSGKTLLTGEDVQSASAEVDTQNGGYEVKLVFSSAGTEKFAKATKDNVGKPLNIYMDETLIESPTVETEINEGTAVINNSRNPMTAETAKKLASQINAGALPFKLVTDNYSTISATLGENALRVTIMAGLLAFILICLFLLLYYRIPGLIGCFALIGCIAGSLLCISIPQFTLTLPGIAGIILSIGMDVDANIITAERVKEELRVGKTLDGAIDAGFERSLAAILDGNVTVVIVGILLMIFGSSTVYSFGYTLIIGEIFNIIMGVTLSRLMLKSISQFPALRKSWMYGGVAE